MVPWVLLRNLAPPASSLEEVVTFLRIRYILIFADLEFSVLFDESIPGDGIVLELGPVEECGDAGPLYRGSASVPKNGARLLNRNEPERQLSLVLRPRRGSHASGGLSAR